MVMRFLGPTVVANSAASVQSEFHVAKVPRKIRKSAFFLGGGKAPAEGAAVPAAGSGVEQRQQQSN